MRIQTVPGMVSNPLPASNVQSKEPSPEQPQEKFEKSDPTFTKQNVAGAVFGAVLLGGAAALGSYYQFPGVAGAAGLAGLSGMVLSAREARIFEDMIGPGVVTGIVGGASAIGGAVMGPGFAAVAGAVGAGLGYIVLSQRD